MKRKKSLSLLLLLLTVMFLPLVGQAKDGDIVERGVIEALTSSAVTVNGIDFLLTARTEFNDENDRPIGLDAFSLGTFVKVKGRPSDRGLLAHEVELEDEHHRSGRDGDSQDDNSNDDSDDDSDDNSDDHHVGKDNSSDRKEKSGRKERKKRKERKREDSSNSENRGSSVKLRTSLSAPEGVSTHAFGKVVYRRRERSNRSEGRLQSKVYIPVPSAIPSLENESAVRTKEISVVIQSTDAVVALCTYRFDHFRRTQSGGVLAEFKLDVLTKSKDGSSERRVDRHGFCDVEPNTDGIQIGGPALSAGDSLVVHDGEVRFLTGIL